MSIPTPAEPFCGVFVRDFFVSCKQHCITIQPLSRGGKQVTLENRTEGYVRDGLALGENLMLLDCGGVPHKDQLYPSINLYRLDVHAAYEAHICTENELVPLGNIPGCVFRRPPGDENRARGLNAYPFFTLDCREDVSMLRLYMVPMSGTNLEISLTVRFPGSAVIEPIIGSSLSYFTAYTTDRVSVLTAASNVIATASGMPEFEREDTVACFDNATNQA